ncbi:MAG: 6-carboxytetrahydropterin synthase QueD [Chitinispirillales bacterium]|jgi:6-pyruvoyltetrahydropterin/6-carboxytetrahydropterin synthase|nr:6-carboxytetrahydropterin synthase QueD [Chitinispirillales bacterium]
MYEITTESHFSAAHRLLNYNGPCENLHGHNWLVRATVKCEELDKSGIGIDFKILKRKLKEIIDEFDHRNLNDLFDPAQSPSSEFIARNIYDKLSESLSADGHGYGGVKVCRVEVQETPGNRAVYYE